MWSLFGPTDRPLGPSLKIKFTYYVTGLHLLLLLLVPQCLEVEGRFTRTLSMEEKCEKFSKLNRPLKEFYSPMYPALYPNQTDCVLKIQAEFGYIIRLDFRDYFDIEPSDSCENDYLEVRDGAHGYADLMGRFCGNDFPPILTSKDSNLWLSFHSDDTLEYRGFKGVYEFIKNTELDRPEIRTCTFQREGEQGIISTEDIPQFRYNYSETYSTPLDCTWIITVKPRQRIYLFFDQFQLAEPNECDVNYVDIFGRNLDLDSRMKHFCGSIADSVTTKGNVMHFRFFAFQRALGSKFKAWFTAYREINVEGTDNDDEKCTALEYDCDDATCIHKDLECNGVKNCRHHYDEENCDSGSEEGFDIRSEHIIIILTLGCGLLGGMCFAMCFNCIKKLIRDGRQIQENIRRSREQLERSQSASMASSPQAVHRPPLTSTDPCYISDVKTNGRPCIHSEEEEEEEEDSEEIDEEEEEEEFEDEESCVEMRDCECQTRDSLLTQRDSGNHHPGLNLTPPPPPTRRPPGLPPLSPPSVPTPPPPPSSHYPRPPSRPPSNHYGGSHPVPLPPRSPHSDPYEVDEDPYNQRYRAEAVIQMRDRAQKQHEPSKTGKSTPDVLVTH